MDLSLLALLDRFVGWVFEELASIPRGIFNPDNRCGYRKEEACRPTRDRGVVYLGRAKASNVAIAVHS